MKKIFIITLLFLAFLSSCTRKAVSLKNASYSEGSFVLISRIYFSRIFPDYKYKNKDKSFKAKDKYSEENQNKIFQFIKKLETQGALAKKWKLRKNSSYFHFYERNVHSLYLRTAGIIWQERFGDAYNSENVFDYYKIKLNYIKLNKYLSLAALKKKLKDSELDTVIGKWKNGDINLQEVRRLSLSLTWDNAVHDKIKGRKQTITTLIKDWLSAKIFNKAIDVYKANKDEVKRPASNFVANLFLQAKYFEATGLYPANPIELDLKPVELFDYFHKIKEKLRIIKKIHCQYTVLKNKTQADIFYDKIKGGNDFYKTAKEYVNNPKYLKSAKLQIIKGYDMMKPVKERENRSFFDKLIIDAAARKKYNPSPYHSPFGYIVLKIHKVEYSEKEVSYKKNIWYIKNELTKKLLSKQYRIDMMDTEKELHFVFHKIKNWPKINNSVF